MEGHDDQYFEGLCNWIWDQQKEITQPAIHWVDDISLNQGPAKLLEHVRLYIDSLGASDIELSNDYTQIKVYPRRE